MKATLTEDPAVYTIEVNGHKAKGMRIVGELGPVKLLKDARGLQVYVYDGSSSHAKAFRVMDEILGNSTAVDVVLIAASPALLDVFTPPSVAGVENTTDDRPSVRSI
jgi:hypothetical protein